MPTVPADAKDATIEVAIEGGDDSVMVCVWVNGKPVYGYLTPDQAANIGMELSFAAAECRRDPETDR